MTESLKTTPTIRPLLIAMFQSICTKLALCIALLLGFNAPTSAQEKAQRVVSIVEDPHDHDWYQNQARLWSQSLKKNPKQEDGWLNLYMAQRMLWIENRSNKEAKAALDDVVKRAGEAVPNTFTSYYLKGTNTGSSLNDEEAFKNTQKAYELDPDNYLTYDKLTVHYEIAQDLSRRREVNKKWFNSGKYSPGILGYNYNVLATLAPNSVIITGGDNDTFPLWILQDALGFRTDVTVLNTFMAKDAAYRRKIFERLGIKTSQETEQKLATEADANNEDAFQGLLFGQLIIQAKAHPLHFALTMGTPSAFQSLEKNLYLVGLANLYSEEKIDNLALLRANFEQKYKLDYLTVRLYKDPAVNVVPMFDQSYISPLILLHNHYKLGGEPQKAANIKTLLVKIARANKLEDQVLPLISE